MAAVNLTHVADDKNGPQPRARGRRPLRGLALLSCCLVTGLAVYLTRSIWVGVPIALLGSFATTFPPREWSTLLKLRRRLRARPRSEGRPRDERYWNTLAPASFPLLFGCAAFVVSPSLGRHVPPSFYGAVVQIIPVLFLAGMVEVVGLRPIVRSVDDLQVTRLLFVGLAIGAIEGECLGLYAIASSTTSTFLLVASATAALAQFMLIVTMVLLARLHSVGPSQNTEHLGSEPPESPASAQGRKPAP